MWLASNVCIHLKLAICFLCHICSSLDLQQFEPVTFPQNNTAQWQCIYFLAQTFMELQACCAIGMDLNNTVHGTGM
jgi:hypothetical protein